MLNPNVPNVPTIIDSIDPIQIIDRSKDPFYSGDLKLMIFGVPLTARDGTTKVYMYT